MKEERGVDFLMSQLSRAKESHACYNCFTDYVIVWWDQLMKNCMRNL